jgi:hypothetical protein
VTNAGRPGPGKYRGTHALRKRCPACKKLRRFFEPPGDVYQGGSRPSRKGWTKLADGRWICRFCPPDLQPVKTIGP